MDISRLPAAPLLRPASATYTSAASPASAEGVGAVRSSRQASRGGEAVERVVQGELLQRERTRYQSTRTFINERRFEHASSGEDQTGAGRPSRTAISHYLNHTRPEALADLTHGTSVNFFV